MLTILSPSKSLDFSSKLPTRKHTEPRLHDQSMKLVEMLRQQSPRDLAALMNISETLAELNVERYQEFDPEPTVENARPAVFAFNGDAYQGMDPQSFTARDITEAQKTLRILSGMYGVLRPLDLIQPHRLEMGTRLKTERGSSLYDWWGTQVTDLVLEDLATSPGSNTLINLASKEYSSALNMKKLQTRVIVPRFEDEDAQGNLKVISFFAKRARGAMAAWIIRGRLRSPRALLDFAQDGYEFAPELSTSDQPVFVRPYGFTPPPAPAHPNARPSR